MAQHRHRSAPRYRNIIRHIAGDCYLVMAGCRCGALRQEIRKDRGQGATTGELIDKAPWEERKGGT